MAINIFLRADPGTCTALLDYLAQGLFVNWQFALLVGPLSWTDGLPNGPLVECSDLWYARKGPFAWNPSAMVGPLYAGVSPSNFVRWINEGPVNSTPLVGFALVDPIGSFGIPFFGLFNDDAATITLDPGRELWIADPMFPSTTGPSVVLGSVVPL
jgi:hypothetical protein